MGTDNATSSPYTIIKGDQIVNGVFVGLRPVAYDPGDTMATVMGILSTAKTGQKIVQVNVTAHHVEVVGGKSAGVKLAELTASFQDDAKINEPEGLGVYGIRKMEIDEAANGLKFEVCLSDGTAAFPLIWHYGTMALGPTPLSGLKAFTDTSLVALLSGLVGGGSGGSDPSAIHEGDTLKVVRA